MKASSLEDRSVKGNECVHGIEPHLTYFHRHRTFLENLSDRHGNLEMLHDIYLLQYTLVRKTYNLQHNATNCSNKMQNASNDDGLFT